MVFSMKVWTGLITYSMYIYQCWSGGEEEEEERVRQTGVGLGGGREGAEEEGWSEVMVTPASGCR